MTKLNETIYNKLTIQAEEAKEQGLIKLADNIISAIGEKNEEQVNEYSYGQFKNDVNKDLWKLATRIITYYDVESVDAAQIDKVILSWASKIVEDLEKSMSIDSSIIGPLEPSVFGETK